MGRHSRPPTYLRHKKPDGSVHARCCLFRRTVYLGKYGSPASYERFKTVQARWQAEMAKRAAEAAAAGQMGIASPAAVPFTDQLTVNDLVAQFWVHATARYRRADGRPTTELGNYRCAYGP